MKIVIDRLSLRNFKGIQMLDIDLCGMNAAIYGANATGKTTIADAFQWLLFDKDTANRSAFSVKPQDADGNEIHHLETVVEAILFVGGAETIIRKTLTEKWVTKRGFDVAEFTGNETSYLIDGVPKKAGEFKAWVGGLVNENTFRLLSSPLHFNTVMSWQDRRKVLFAMIDDVSDQQVATENPKYARVEELLDKHGLDDARKALAYQIKTLEKERTGITPRVDELSRGIPEIEASYVALAQSAIKECNARLDALDATAGDAERDAAHLRSLYARINALEAQKARRAQEAVQEANRARTEGLKALYARRAEVERTAASIADAERALNAAESRLAPLEQEVAEARTKYIETYEEQYVAPDYSDRACPTCEQPLPEEMIAENEMLLLAAWERDKSRRLMHVQALGKALKSDVDAQKERIAQIQAVLVEANDRASAERFALSMLEHWETAPEVEPDIDTAPEDAEITAILAEIDGMAKPDNTAIATQRKAIMTEIQGHQAVIAQSKERDRAKDRIAQLQEREAEIGRQLTELEGQRYLLEQLVTDKCALLEDRVNALFPTARWKLFDRAINGGITDCCECLIGGVPYPDANNAAKINAGLEIIQRLCEHEGVNVPIFIDNAESVNALADTSSQTISLVVSLDSELRIVAGGREAAA